MHVSAVDHGLYAAARFLPYLDLQTNTLNASVAMCRAWAAQIQARYQMFNPDAARPARRIYVGGLPPETTDVSFLPPILTCSSHTT